MPSGAVISISSHVARGSVGNRAMVFALERLGFETWAVPTIVLAAPSRPRAGRSESCRTTTAFAAASSTRWSMAGARRCRRHRLRLSRLAGAGARRRRAGRDGEGGAARRALSLRPGDRRRRAGSTSPRTSRNAVRDALLPLADIATPNAFECAWLAGAHNPRADAEPDLAALARTPAAARGPRHLRAGDDARAHRQPARHRARRDPLRASAARRRRPRAPATSSPRSSSRAGCEGRAWRRRRRLALASVFEIVASTAKAGADELMLAALPGCARRAACASIVGAPARLRQFG